MQVVLTIDETDLRDAITDINDEKRQSEDPNKLTIRGVKAKLKDPEFRQHLAEEVLTLTLTLEALA